MRLLIIKFLILAAGIMGATVVATGQFNPHLSGGDGKEGIDADSIYAFGSNVFYEELEKPGNEYLRTNTEGYSRDMLPSSGQEDRFRVEWDQGVSAYKSGYNGCLNAYFKLASIPEMTSDQHKRAVGDDFKQAKEELQRSVEHFTAAKASASLTSPSGFKVGMVLPRLEQTVEDAEDAEIASLKAVLADRDGDTRKFQEYLKDAGVAIRKMKDIRAELKVLNNDFT